MWLLMSDVLIEHTAVIYHEDGTRCTVGPHEDAKQGLFRIAYHDGDKEHVILMFPDMALALSSVITRIVSLNAKAPR